MAVCLYVNVGVYMCNYVCEGVTGDPVCGSVGVGGRGNLRCRQRGGEDTIKPGRCPLYQQALLLGQEGQSPKFTQIVATGRPEAGRWHWRGGGGSPVGQEGPT